VLSSSTSSSIEAIIVVVSRRAINIVDLAACHVVAIVNGDTFF
jgi:hypothetical protein